MGILGSGSVHMSGRYAKKPVTGRLGAVNAVCQKCLQKGHWTYDCKASASVYQSRPSRTKQLMDPNYKPRFLGASELLPGDAKKGKDEPGSKSDAKKKRKKPAGSSDASSDDSSNTSSSSDDSSSSSSSSSSSDGSSSSDDSSSSSSSDSTSSESSSSSDTSSSPSSDSNSSSSDDSSSDSDSGVPPPKKMRAKKGKPPALSKAAATARPHEGKESAKELKTDSRVRAADRGGESREGGQPRREAQEHANGGGPNSEHRSTQAVKKPKIRSRVVAA